MLGHAGDLTSISKTFIPSEEIETNKTTFVSYNMKALSIYQNVMGLGFVGLVKMQFRIGSQFKNKTNKKRNNLEGFFLLNARGHMSS